MQRNARSGLLNLFALGLSLSAALGCAGSSGADKNAPSKKAFDYASLPPPPEELGAKLASIGNSFVRETPSPDGKIVGSLRPGGLAVRGMLPVSTENCPTGWYQVRPRGFVCVGETATLDLSHPSLGAMKVQPKLDAPLPYTYERASMATKLFEWDKGKGAVVHDVAKIRRGSGMAIVGAWDAIVPEGKMQKLHLLPDGRFVIADEVKAVDSNFFQGIALTDEVKLPVAFVIRRGVNRFKVTDGAASKTDDVNPLTSIRLTGKFRTITGEKLWATEDGDFLRHKDITVVNKRDAYPDFATGDQKWVDISIVSGTATYYEGKKPVYVTLVSAGRDRFGDPKQSASTQLGVHTIVAKSITSNESGPKAFAEEYDLRDVPWVMELSSGQMIHGAYWHSRFGIEHGLGNLQLSPPDAAFLFRWADLQIPQGWHSYRLSSDQEKKTLVLVRK